MFKLPLLTGTSARRFHANIAALQTLRALGNKTPTEEQRQTLSQYSGWGDTETLKRAFPHGHYNHSTPGRELLDLALTKEEQDALLASTLNAHYTPPAIIQAIYRALLDAGMTDWPSVNLLEPSAGVGNFLGSIPDDAFRSRCQVTAVELDNLSGEILSHLYPEAKVFRQGFEIGRASCRERVCYPV